MNYRQRFTINIFHFIISYNFRIKNNSSFEIKLKKIHYVFLNKILSNKFYVFNSLYWFMCQNTKIDLNIKYLY